MTAVKSTAQIRHLAENRLPVSGADVMRLVEENERLRSALKWFVDIGTDYTRDNERVECISRARAALRSEEEET